MSPSPVLLQDAAIYEAQKLPLFHPLSRRLHTLLLMMIGFFVIVSMRINMGVAMTCMVNSTAVTQAELAKKNARLADLRSLSILDNSSIVLPPEPLIEESGAAERCGKTQNEGDVVINDYGGSLFWDSTTQGWLFSSIFYGSILTILPAGYLADTQSPKHLASISAIILTIGTFATPYLAVNSGWFALFIMRVIMGCGDGLVIPAVNKMCSFWVPVAEKSTAATIYTSGFSLASVLGVPTFAYLCSSSFGWPSIFYTCATAGVLWTTVWHFTTPVTPHGCHVIAKREREYLLSRPELQLQSKHARKFEVPWKAMLTSPAFYSLLLCAFSMNIIITFLHAYQPSFYKEVLYLSPVDNGIFGAIPPFVEIFWKFMWAIAIDHLKAKKVLTPTAACKISQTFSGTVTVLAFIVIAFYGNCENPYLTLTMFCFVAISLSTTSSGFFTSMLSIAPPYTGMISSASMLCGITARVITPIMVSFFRSTGTFEEWRPIFFIIAATTAASTIFFVFFSSGDVQDWAKSQEYDHQTKVELEELQKEHEFEVDGIAADTMA
uniref:MFS domain-containing protein n=1 Tax=Panagrellus redivivus TaxID=6233 RepID=A0A7E4ZY18_PANRE